MAGNAAGERELGEEALHALLVLRDVRIDLAVGSLEVGVRDQARPAMPGTGDVEHVQVVLLDQPVQMDVDEVQTWRGPPVAEKPWLDVLLGQWLLEQRVVIEVDLADRQVIRGRQYASMSASSLSDSPFSMSISPSCPSHYADYTGHGFAPQMSAAYSAMVRSLENFPEAATFRMALCAH